MPRLIRAPWIQMFSSAAMSGSALLIPNILRNEFDANTVQIGIILASFNAALFLHIILADSQTFTDGASSFASVSP
jgi:hypothetical protein